jgi:hypothetical protein
METRSGAKGTLSNGVFFCESAIPKAEYKGFVSVEISRQNSTLSAVKEALAAKAVQLGGNAVADFRYGQKAHPWWEQIFTLKWDTESWFGEGKAVRILDATR